MFTEGQLTTKIMQDMGRRGGNQVQIHVIWIGVAKTVSNNNHIQDFTVHQ